ncbi:hypothetical protein EXIGLDRAFT_137471 [Exidia glandulosa HHB12029]|uniref:Uncharacterized protein n=1 Tax=Exidia glandulosa HHB12029 TaxID=1314781 RepID=A0A165G0T2_EXIGL|nr:hypothetical protein EXIGLDRAFT_137471 [Exidia glandulosa HHB12029]
MLRPPEYAQFCGRDFSRLTRARIYGSRGDVGKLGGHPREILLGFPAFGTGLVTEQQPEPLQDPMSLHAPRLGNFNPVLGAS